MIAPTPASPAPENRPNVFIVQPQYDWVSMVPAPSPSHLEHSKSKTHTVLIAGVIAGSMLALISAVGFFLFRRSKVVTVKPWATGLSGQLQKAFVTGKSSFSYGSHALVRTHKTLKLPSTEA
jgi:hypothetical protein